MRGLFTAPLGRVRDLLWSWVESAPGCHEPLSAWIKAPAAVIHPSVLCCMLLSCFAVRWFRGGRVTSYDLSQTLYTATRLLLFSILFFISSSLPLIYRHVERLKTCPLLMGDILMTFVFWAGVNGAVRLEQRRIARSSH